MEHSAKCVKINGNIGTKFVLILYLILVLIDRFKVQFCFATRITEH